MTYDLLNEPLIEALEADESRLFSLPGLLAAWADGQPVLLDGIRPHQRPPMHMLLCQLAVLGIQRGGDDLGLEAPEEVWRARLLKLAPAAAWHLVADTQNDPAFLQPPAIGADLKSFSTIARPDDFTTLISAKNHAVKQSAMAQATPWLWVVALVEKQSSSRYDGATQYGIARMNGGLGSRPLVSVYPDMADGARWRRDVAAILERQPGLLEAASMFTPGDNTLALTWLAPWDGISQLSLDSLDPLFVETARQVRLVIRDGAIVALSKGSKAARVAMPSDLHGRLGDPWAPLDDKGDKVLTLSEDGWTLRRLVGLILPTGDTPLRPSLLQAPRRQETGDLFFHAAALCGGQGKTGGFHQVTLPIPGRIVIRLATLQDAAEGLGQTAQVMLSEADMAQGILRHALLSFQQGGPTEKIKGDRDPGISTWVGVFQHAVQHAFFPALWDMADARDDSRPWRRFLHATAERVLGEAIKSLSVRSMLFFRAEARSRSLLWSRLRASLPLDLDLPADATESDEADRDDEAHSDEGVTA